MAIEWSAEACSDLSKDITPDRLPPPVWTDAMNVRFYNNRTEKRMGQEEALYNYTTATPTSSPAPTGAGTVSSITTYTTSVAETITLTANSPPSTFTVTGSVSGAIGTATVGTAFESPQIGFTITDGSPDFVAGDQLQIVLTKDAPSININHMIPWSTSTTYNWIYASLTKIHLWNGTTHSNITRQDTASPTADVDYNADADEQWTSCVLGEVVVFNNPNDLPQYYGSGSTDMANFVVDTDSSPSDAQQWPANLRCKAMRAYKQYLVAMNLSEGATLEPQNIRWSTAADPGSLPLWGIADPTLEAGETTLAETDGEVVDGLTLGDTFVIYKEDSVWGMQLIGGQFVMRFFKMFGDGGMLTQNCAVQVDGNHYVFGKNDVYVHNGSSKNSIIDGKVKSTLFQQIDDTYVNRSYVVADRRNREVLFCYVLANSGATYPNRALVYNTQSGTVTFRDLPGSGFLGFGEVPADLNADSWATVDINWDESTDEWGAVAGKPTEDRLLIPNTTGQTFYAEGRTNTDGGTAFRAYAEKLGIDGGDLRGIKHVYRMYPRIEGSSGGVVKCYVGGEEVVGQGYDWSDAQDYTIGTTQAIDVSQVYGRKIGVRFETTDDIEWNISGYSLEGQISGNV